MINDTVILSHANAKVESPLRRPPRHGGKRLHLSVKMGHHIEMVGVLADKGPVRFEIDDSKKLARTMHEVFILVGFEHMRKPGLHEIM